MLDLGRRTSVSCPNGDLSYMDFNAWLLGSQLGVARQKAPAKPTSVRCLILPSLPIAISKRSNVALMLGDAAAIGRGGRYQSPKVV
ncbi:hypothetical protein TWF788_009639 [Orbilia oligospora]|uniref:Uncharacterized protein n=1 Tax=Orbilia oligospora TaxID=2813651 RepID=A0A6G1LX51_ORBOL|nr:hypothetical protein TWF788_009639 [Orbilia oligospora]KAF3203171.1 hypothetical protein TWF679_010481 [Orbilia oligospora]KAF3237620.1 hypothetical protein TWF192_010836 [Orbilia oligospora]